METAPPEPIPNFEAIIANFGTQNHLVTILQSLYVTVKMTEAVDHQPLSRYMKLVFLDVLTKKNRSTMDEAFAQQLRHDFDLAIIPKRHTADAYSAAADAASGSSSKFNRELGLRYKIMAEEILRPVENLYGPIDPSIPKANQQLVLDHFTRGVLLKKLESQPCTHEQHMNWAAYWRSCGWGNKADDHVAKADQAR